MFTNRDFNTIVNIVLHSVKDTSAVYLFGSYATGRATAESDVDVAVLTNGTLDRKEKLKTLNLLWNEVSAKGLSVDFIIKPYNDFEEEKALPTMSRVIAQEGKLLWQKT